MRSPSITTRVIGHPFLHERVHSLLRLNHYYPTVHDVKFNFGDDYNGETMIVFERYWRSNGMVNIFEVVEVVIAPNSDGGPYAQRKYLIARFENAESALVFRLTIL
jgi:hypothetical protein